MEIERRPDLQVMKPAVEASAPPDMPMAQRIGAEQLQAFTKTLEEYKAGKVQTEQRILASENWCIRLASQCHCEQTRRCHESIP